MATARQKVIQRREQTMVQIREGYHRISVDYGLAQLGQHFEERYRSALDSKLDTDKFLEEEMKLLADIGGELQAKAEKKEQIINKYLSRSLNKGRGRDYPILANFDEFGQDVGMLYSAIHRLLSSYWPEIKFYLEGAVQHYNLTNLQRSMSSIYNDDVHTLPFYLRKYKSYMENNLSHIHKLRLSQQSLQEAGIWLNSLSEMLALAKLNQDMPPVVEEAEKIIDQLVDDFRLKIFTQRTKGV